MQVIYNNHNNKTIWSSNKKINKYFKIKTKSNIYKNLDQIFRSLYKLVMQVVILWWHRYKINAFNKKQSQTNEW